MASTKFSRVILRTYSYNVTPHQKRTYSATTLYDIGWCIRKWKTGTAVVVTSATRTLHSSSNNNNNSPPAVGPYQKLSYEEAFNWSTKNPGEFWAEQADKLVWFKKWDRVLDDSNPPFTNWFVGGELNTCYNALDRHLESGLGGRTAVIYDSPITGVKKKYSYAEMHYLVSKFAGVLSDHGVRRGDRVLIYMPMIPETLVAMLACARLGAVHSVVFGGFAARELSSRISHCEPKVIVSASGGVEPNRVVEYKPILDEAIDLASCKPRSCILYQRQSCDDHFPTPIRLRTGRDYDWAGEMEKARPHDCVPVPATDPLYILYTSGTTGLPKGVVRPSGGHAVVLPWSMQTVFGLVPGDVWWASSDLGWVVGHSYICYGPLLFGLTSVLYEGKPVGTPDSSQYMRVIDEHQVVGTFCTPTALRAIRQVDQEKGLRSKYAMRKLKAIFPAGERLDHQTRLWAEQEFRVPAFAQWWQTETGWPITATCTGCYPHKDALPRQPPDASGLPVPGWNVKVMADDHGSGHGDHREAQSGQLGRIVVQFPLPPGCLSSFWRNDDGFQNTYFNKYPGFYDSMDAGSRTTDGYICVMSRVDDVISVAGHRISGGALEEAVSQHEYVVECAVIALKDQLKGEVPVAFCVLNETFNGDYEKVESEVVDLVRSIVGPVAAMKRAVIVRKLPKTRSGKIARNTLTAMANNQPYSIPVTIEDASVYPAIEEVLRRQRLIH